MSTEIIITYGNDPVLADVKSELSTIQEMATCIQINSDVSKNEAVIFLSKVKDLLKRIEDKRKAYKVPLDKQAKELQKFFKALSDPLEMADKSVRRSVEEYIYKQEMARRKQEEANLKKIEKAVETGKAMPVLKTVQVDNQIKTAAGTLSANLEWKAEIYADSTVPREYCVPDIALIRSAVKSGVREIPGVRIFEAVKSSLR